MSARDNGQVDARVRSLYDRASIEEPPQALDDALRAAARRAVSSGPGSNGERAAAPSRTVRTWWPLAAAATIGAIAIGMVEMMPPDERIEPAATRSADTPPPRVEAFAPTPSVNDALAPAVPAAARPEATQKQPARGAAPQRERAERTPQPASSETAVSAPRERSRADETSAPRAFPAPAAPVIADAPSRSAPVVRDAPAPPAPVVPDSPAPPVAPPAASAAKPSAAPAAPAAAMSPPLPMARTQGAAAAKTTLPPTFDERVRTIEALLQEQRYEQARRELARLREDYPDRMDRLAPELRALLPPR